LELVYLWVENYKNIHEQGFNFSSRFNCDYNKKINELTIKENDEYIPDFFGKNINVTAIVGKNGSGKSSVLNAIINIVEYFFIEETNYILVFMEDEDKFYYSNFNFIQKTLIMESSKLEGRLIVSINEIDNDKSPLAFIDKDMDESPIKDTLNAISTFKPYEIIDISIQKIANLLIDNLKKENNLSFKLSTFMYLPNQISIEFISKEQIIEKYLYSIFSDRTKIKDSFMQINDEYHEFLFIEYIKYLKKNHLITFGSEKAIIDLMKNKDKLEKKLKNMSIMNIDDFYRFFYPLRKKKIFIISDLTEKEKSIYIRENRYLDYFNIDFIDKRNRKYNDLSHGEKTIFGQLLNLYFFKEDENMIFLFDEPEVSLHPSWQKKYINEICNLLLKFDNKNHFIFTTHSPFLLSDIPKQNIIFLDTDENGNCKIASGLKETFGQNIHTLLSDSFFMEDGLIGEFAKRKINEIKKLYQLTQNKNIQKRLENQKIKELAQKAFNRRKERLWQIQKIIGEAFLQRVIKNYLDDLELLFSDDKTLIAKELAEIEERKKHLEALQKRRG